MEQNNTRENTEMGEVISTTEAFIEKNKKLLIIVIVAAIALALVIFGVVKMAQNRNLKANQEMFAAEQYFAQGDFEKALALGIILLFISFIFPLDFKQNLSCKVVTSANAQHEPHCI